MKSNNPKVSVIMPVYNGVEFLKTALDSVVNQSLKEIELICINDGSTDNSLEILEEYAKNDDRIKIFNQENQGQGAAKNYALSKVNGDYVMFLDQDDYLELNACEVAYDYITRYDVDLTIFSATTFTELEKDVAIERHIQIYNYFPDLIYRPFNLCDLGESVRAVNVPPWSKIYKKTLFENKNLRFTSGALIEDLAFLIALISINPKTIIIKEILYNYNYPRAGQISAVKGAETLSLFKSFENFEYNMNKLTNYNFVKKGLLTLKFIHLFSWYKRSKWYVKIPYLLKYRYELLKLYQDGWTDNDLSQIMDLELVHAFLGFNFIKIEKFANK